MSQSFTQGRTDGLKGLTPISTLPDYLEGYAAGKRRRSRGWNKNTGSQLQAAEQDIKDRYGCKYYPTAKRCPRCRTLNTKRNKVGVCLGCCMKAKGVPA